MQKHLPNIALFVVLAGGLIAGWWYVDKTFFPKPEPKPEEPKKPAKEVAGALLGSAALGTSPVDGYPGLLPPLPVSRSELQQTVIGGLYAGGQLAERAVAPKPAAAVEAPTLIALGDEKFFKNVYLSTRGGAIQQITLTKFEEGNRIGREVKRPDGTPQPLRVIPGIVRPLDRKDLRAEAHFPDLAPGKVPADVLPLLAEPSYAMLHYPAVDDPKHEADTARRMNDEHPSTDLAERTWTVVEQHQPTDGSEWRVVFETTLEAPYFLKLRKTFTLAAKDYHVGLKIDVEPLPGRERGKGKFRYQIVGARGIPVEGEWYTPTYRNALIGSRTSSGGAKRTYDDAKSIYEKAGSDKITRGDNQFTYAAVATQYFASAIAVDDTAKGPAQYPWDYVRATREPIRKSGGVRTQDEIDAELKAEAEQPFLSDITVRVVSTQLDPSPGETVTHQYVIYNGPVKVRLLGQLTGDKAVSDELVTRYLDNLTLRTMTDYHSPNFFGRVANSIFWTDVIVMFTNLMHSLLGWLHQTTGLPWGVCIIMLTVMVRLLLFIPSRKQQTVMARMQEKMAKVKPEIDKLTEKYKDDPQTLQQEKTKLMLKAGVNPMSTMGGCLLLFAQMPIFMGLYYCLQESVFFRLEPFLWFPNLSAPDMTVWWTESIPWVSTPDNLGGSIYLGPFWNILPLITVALIYTQQRLTMPPPTDEQQEMQQRMMKFMIVFMAVFFYKSPSGLCVYFICSTSWALAERKLIPKPKPRIDPVPTPGSPPELAAGTNGTAPAPGEGGFLSRLRDKIEKMQESAEGQRQIRNDSTPQRPTGMPQGKRDKKKRKK